MSLKITGEMRGSAEVKRFYYPRIDIVHTCPKCGHSTEHDYYLSHPRFGEPMKLFLYCPECEHKWAEMILIRVTIEVVAGRAAALPPAPGGEDGTQP